MFYTLTAQWTLQIDNLSIFRFWCNTCSVHTHLRPTN